MNHFSIDFKYLNSRGERVNFHKGVVLLELHEIYGIPIVSSKLI